MITAVVPITIILFIAFIMIVFGLDRSNKRLKKNLVDLKTDITEFKKDIAEFQENCDQLQKDFAIVEQLLTPFLEWVDDTRKKQTQMMKIAKEKTEALQKQQTRKEDKS